MRELLHVSTLMMQSMHALFEIATEEGQFIVLCQSAEREGAWHENVLFFFQQTSRCRPARTTVHANNLSVSCTCAAGSPCLATTQPRIWMNADAKMGLTLVLGVISRQEL